MKRTTSEEYVKRLDALPEKERKALAAAVADADIVFCSALLQGKLAPVIVTEEMVKANIDGLDKLLNFYFEKRDSMKPLPKLLDGFDVMKLLNIKASPKLGKILDALKEEQLNGNINTKEEAEKFIKGFRE